MILNKRNKLLYSLLFQNSILTGRIHQVDHVDALLIRLGLQRIQGVQTVAELELTRKNALVWTVQVFAVQTVDRRVFASGQSDGGGDVRLAEHDLRRDYDVVLHVLGNQIEHFDLKIETRVRYAVVEANTTNQNSWLTRVLWPVQRAVAAGRAYAARGAGHQSGLGVVLQDAHSSLASDLLIVVPVQTVQVV